MAGLFCAARAASRNALDREPIPFRPRRVCKAAATTYWTAIVSGAGPLCTQMRNGAERHENPEQHWENGSCVDLGQRPALSFVLSP